MATYDVADRSAIVTGAGSGIGAATAEVLASSGASVLVVDRFEDHAQTVADKITADGGVAVAFGGDVVQPAIARAMVTEAGKLGPLRIAVNNAGRTPLGSAELLDWCRTKLLEHYDHVVEHLEDMPEIRDWTLPPR